MNIISVTYQIYSLVPGIFSYIWYVTAIHNVFVCGKWTSPNAIRLPASTVITTNFDKSLQWRHNEHDSVSNHQPHNCLLNRLFRRRSKSLAFVRGIHWWLVNSPNKWPVMRKMFPFDDVIIFSSKFRWLTWYMITLWTFKMSDDISQSISVLRVFKLVFRENESEGPRL